MNIEEILPPQHDASTQRMPAEPAPAQSAEDALQELVKLRDEGTLSYEAFAARKAVLLAQL